MVGLGQLSAWLGSISRYRSSTRFSKGLGWTSFGSSEAQTCRLHSGELRKLALASLCGFKACGWTESVLSANKPFHFRKIFELERHRLNDPPLLRSLSAYREGASFQSRICSLAYVTQVFSRVSAFAWRDSRSRAGAFSLSFLQSSLSLLSVQLQLVLASQSFV